MADYPTLQFSIDQGIATITLNRPDAANGMDMQMGKDLMDAAINCEANDEVRAVVITANGKMFSAGGDLKSFAAYGDGMYAKLKELTVYLHTAITRFARMDAPVIVAVNGMSAGAGFSLAVAGDMVLCAESAKFTMAYTAAGLTPDVSASYYLPRFIGLRKTQELMLTNRRLSAQEALDWGLVNRVVADDELQQEAQALARQLAAGPTKAYGAVKGLLADTFQNGIETQLDKEADFIASMTKLADGKEGVTAFMEKRAPVFKGC
jgi:2-(1,2-epoxy-1,2-dihydrophenyl)acetyl-CoA isomerase